MKKNYLTLLLIVGVVGFVSGQEIPPSPKRKIHQRVLDDGVITFQTVVGTYARPLQWKKKDWLRLGGVLAVSASSLWLDKPVYKFSIKHRTPFLDDMERVGDFLGQPENNYPFMIAFWGTGVLVNNDWMRDTGMMIFASVTTSGIVQTLAKSLVGRARPQTNGDIFSFRPYGGPSYHSFPSGHAMLSIATSWILARRVNFLPAKILFYSLPVLVSWSRLYGNAHWFSDIVLGNALGIACAETVLKLFPKIKQKRINGIAILPRGNGLGITYSF